MPGDGLRPIDNIHFGEYITRMKNCTATNHKWYTLLKCERCDTHAVERCSACGRQRTVK